MNQHDGGLVFPGKCLVNMNFDPDAPPLYAEGEQPGLTLRDYLASQAIACVCHPDMLITAMTPEEIALQIQNAAALSYRIADAMLAARVRANGQ